MDEPGVRHCKRAESLSASEDGCNGSVAGHVKGKDADVWKVSWE